jgi:hypothetical protein
MDVPHAERETMNMYKRIYRIIDKLIMTRIKINIYIM